MLVDSLDCLLLVFIRKMTNSIRRSCKISKAGRKLNLGLVKTAYFLCLLENQIGKMIYEVSQEQRTLLMIAVMM